MLGSVCLSQLLFKYNIRAFWKPLKSVSSNVHQRREKQGYGVILLRIQTKNRMNGLCIS